MSKRRKKKNKWPKILLILFILIGLGAAGYYFYFKDKGKPILPILEKKEKETPKLKIVDENSDTRPFAVMINNHNTARKYHAGLQDAYLVYEMIVEGGITRLMALYKDQDLDKIGSVRSARHYFLDYALENDAIYVHWGWSPQAQSDIKTLDIDNINGLTYEGKYFFRDKSLKVSSEHTGFTKTDMLNEAAEKLNYRKTSNKDLLLNYSVDNIDLSTTEDAMVANNIDIPFSKYLKTSYIYDEENKVYKRYVNDEVHQDYVTKEQYTAKNIITYKLQNGTIVGDEKGRQDIDTTGSGEGYYITGGYAIPITWEKSSRKSQTIYKYLDGEEIKVNDGNTYIEIEPTSQTLNIS